MKTTIHKPNDLQAQKPVNYPCLVTEDGEYAIAINAREGLRLHPRVAGGFDTGGSTWLEAGWKPIREPVTITFHPST